MPAERRFRVMGSDAHLVVVGDERYLDSAEARLHQLEARWSRFRDTSEVSRLNASAGGPPVQVSEDTALLFRRALQGWKVTGGLYDPTLLGDVVRAGYDRSFEQLDPDAPPQDPGTVSGAEAIQIDPAGLIRLPAGVGFDPGGIGKGLAADMVVAETIAAGASGVSVSMGGDVRVAGQPPTGDAWRVGVERPGGDGRFARVLVKDGAVATSSRLRRRWHKDGQERHHLIDPSTGRPATTEVVAVTVVAAQGWQAEVLSKAAFLSPDLELVTSLGAAAVAFDESGEPRFTSTWHALGVLE